MAIYQSKNWLQSRVRHFQIGFLLIAFILSIGTVGYMLIEGWSLVDSFYMCAITISTVGYGEVHELSDSGKIFTSLLIFADIIVAAYAFSIITSSIIEGELKKIRGFHKMQKNISKLKNHTIVCGYGRLASIVVKDLLQHKKELIVIESDSSKIPQLEALGIPYVEGNADDEDTLKAAGIERAKTLLTLVSKESDNFFVTLTARDLNPKLSIIARSEGTSSNEAKLKRAGANHIISPYNVSGAQIVQQMLRPNVSTFLKIASGSSHDQLVFEEIVVPADSPLIGKTLAETNLRQKTGAIIAGIISQNGEMSFNPNADSLIEEGSTLIVLGTENSMEKLNEFIVIPIPL